MRILRARAAVVLASLVLCRMAAAQAETPASVVQKAPQKSEIRVGNTSYGTLYTWKITDYKSPYFGLTLVWLELKESKSLVSVEKTNGASAIPSTLRPDTFAVLSGGSWTGAYDSPNGSKSSSGLVVASGTQVSPLTSRTGGVMVACNDDLEIYDSASYGSKYARGLICPKGTPGSALQTSAIVIRDGKSQTLPAGERANRLAIGQDEDQVIIAGAFTQFGTAVTLPDFSSYVAAAAKKLGRNDLTALNLDGACSAQLFIPSLNRRFGCDSPGYNINRILVRREP